MAQLERVEITADAYGACLAHALSTEREEVMGLLLGEVTRVDRRKDRVEISSDQLSSATSWAETAAKQSNRPLRVLGWYHSHPHITVWPSHVDLQTQLGYQMMEATWIGLILSCFNEHQTSQRIELTGFQAIRRAGIENVPIPVVIEPANLLSNLALDALVQLPRILQDEEKAVLLQAQMQAADQPLALVHNSAVFSSALCRLMDRVNGPILSAMAARMRQSEALLNQLRAERDALLAQVTQLTK